MKQTTCGPRTGTGTNLTTGTTTSGSVVPGMWGEVLLRNGQSWGGDWFAALGVPPYFRIAYRTGRSKFRTVEHNMRPPALW